MQASAGGASNTLLYALAEHVQFRKDGWHDEAIKRATLCALHERSSGGSQSTLAKQVASVLGITVETHRVIDVIEELARDGSIVPIAGHYHLSEAERGRLDRTRAAAEKVTEQCKERLERIARKHGQYPSLNWQVFLDNLVIPMTNELGTRTFDLLRGTTPIHDTDAARRFVNAFPAIDQESVRAAVTDYLDPVDTNVRSHLLGYLTNYSLLAAGGLSREQVNNLVAETGSKKLDILIDTNVAFSMLKLHKNPLNDATEALLKLQRHLGGGVAVQFHMLESTLTEAHQSLEAAASNSRTFAAPRPFEEAAETSGALSGLVGAYLDARAKNRLLSADSYFAPYLNGLDAILNERGIDILSDEDVRARRRTQERVDAWKSFEWGRERPKTRDQLLHDLTAIESVIQQRGGRVTRAADAGWWFVTLDLRLQSQERQDLAGSARLPSTINPAELVQLIRIWVPRSTSMEEALVGAIRMPFAFYSYDRDLEKSALAILQTVSGFEGVDELDSGAALRVFQDSALREQLLAHPTDEAARTTAVRQAIQRVDLEYRDRAVAAEKQVQLLQREQRSTTRVEPRSPKSRTTTTHALKERDRWKTKASDLQRELDAARSQIRAAEHAENETSERLKNLSVVAADRAKRIVRSLRTALTLVGIVVTCAAAVVFLLFPDPSSRIPTSIAFIVGVAAFVVQLVLFLPKREPSSEDKLTRRIENKLRQNNGFPLV